MSITSEDHTVSVIGVPGGGKSSPALDGESSENSLRLLVWQTWVLTWRQLRRWSRERATVLETLIMPVVLLFTLHIVLGDGIKLLTGHDSLHNTVPLIAIVGAMAGSMMGTISLMGEREDGFLSRMWVLPVHRAAGLLSRLAADGVRIVITTVVILGAGMVLGFRFQQGLLEAVVWLFVPVFFGLAFTTFVIAIALYSSNTLAVEATEIFWGLLMFFSIGFVPLDQYPKWIQPAVEYQPVSLSIAVMRGLSLGGPILAPMIGVLIWVVGIAAVCVVPMAVGYRRASMRG